MRPNDRKYNISVSNQIKTGNVDVQAGCNGFTATNVGDTIVRVNDVLLYPGTIGTNLGDSVQIGGNENEIFAGYIKVVFNIGGANPNVQIVQKIFIDYQI